ncbi:MAG: hypothetical protein PHE93_04225 [Clostridia bacterium]|nr:hypothetical protein [Clostridia bacterium]
MSDYSSSALEILRQPAKTMQWYIIPILLIVMYIVTKELKDKNYNVLFGAAALWGMDLLNEIWNSIVFNATGFAPVWGTPVIGAGTTSLLILIGYNIEISFMFMILGITACKMLPQNPKTKLFKSENSWGYKTFCAKLPDIKKQKALNFQFNNRVVYALVLTLLCVCIECFLNYCGVLTWEYSWWSRSCPYLVYLIGYLPFFTMAFLVHDFSRKKQLITLGIIFGVDILLLIIFGSIGWM